MKIASVVGARPQFVKCALLSKTLRKSHDEILIHTGQHFHKQMSGIFFDELGIPNPQFNLGISGGLHGNQTGRMLQSLEKVLSKQQPDCLIVYGDTNSTLAGALAASKLNIPVFHIEAGLRSFNRKMPEEINRLITDHLSNLLFCPTKTSLSNLEKEGIHQRVHLVGNVMFDILVESLSKSSQNSSVLSTLFLRPREYYLATLHRQDNVDDKKHLLNILLTLNSLDMPVVLPLHPRTRNAIREYGLKGKLGKGSLRFTDPMGYLDMIDLEMGAEAILTDSGGIQNEAYFLGVPCITLRDETEWVETVQEGRNVLTGANPEAIVEAVHNRPKHHKIKIHRRGRVSKRISSIINKWSIAQIHE